MKLRRFLFIIVLLFISGIQVQTVFAKDTLLVGDSRTHGLASYVDGAKKNMYVLAEGGAGVPWLLNMNKGDGTLGTVMPDAITNNLTDAKSGKLNLSKQISKNQISSVVFCLGVNGPSDTNFNNYMSYIKKFIKNNKDVKVYVATLLPTTSKCSSVSNKQVKQWNKKTKNKASSIGFTVVDSYKAVTKIDNWSNETSDGLHYSATVYKAVYKDIKATVKSGDSGTTGTTEPGKGGISNDKMRSLVGCSKATMNKIIAIVDVMRQDGYSDEAIAGALGNSWQESGWNPLSEGGWGLCDTYGDWKKSKYYKNCTHKKQVHNDNGAGGTHDYEWCESGVCTTTFAMATLGHDLSSYKQNTKNYNAMLKAHGDDIKKWTWNGKKYDLPTKVRVCSTLNDFKKLDNSDDAALIWMQVMERCKGIYLYCIGGWHSGSASWSESMWEPERASGVSGYGAIKNLVMHEHGTKNAGRPFRGRKVLKWLGGGGAKGANKGNAEAAKNAADLAQNLVSSGYWTEEQLSNYIKMSELDLSGLISEANKENLESEDSDAINSLESWEQDIEKNEEEGGLLHILRSIVSFIGILFTIWVVLIYLAYWFDRVNSIYDISFLSILTFGRLTLSPEDDDCTFKLSELGRQDKRTVNHKAIIEICIIGMIFGVSLITGAIYKIVIGIINLAFKILGDIF